jgi:hypothetical protein
MQAIKSYPSRLEADLARIALEAEGIPAFVAGIGLALEGGPSGVQLMVPDDQVAAALAVLADN